MLTSLPIIALVSLSGCGYDTIDDLEDPDLAREVVDRHLSARVEEYQSRCDAGEARFCAALGDMYRAEAGVDQDEERAVELHRKACAGGVTTSCTPSPTPP